MPVQTAAPSLSVPVKTLTGSQFREFGEVIENPATHNDTLSFSTVAANQGSATKVLDVTHMHNHYHLAPSQKPAKPVLNMFVCKPRELTPRDDKSVFPVKILERHPFTPQTFIPMGLDANDTENCYLIIVAPTLPITRSQSGAPPYPVPSPDRKPSLRQRLLGTRPNPFTNDYVSSTTPPVTANLSPSIKPKGTGLPDLSKVQAFVARGDQAVTYGPGTWHAPMVALGKRPIEFVVVQFANGVGIEDCQEIEIVAEAGKAGLDVVVDADMLVGPIGERARL